VVAATSFFHGQLARSIGKGSGVGETQCSREWRGGGAFYRARKATEGRGDGRPVN
jgi:hypothetical protein